jgi:glutathione S-transferase
MKLYYAPGTASLAPHIALREADRHFDLERVDLRTHRTESGGDYLAINPHGHVPALELGPEGGPVLTENAAILQYIADLAPSRGLAPPIGSFARYHLQDWLSFLASDIHAPFVPLAAPETPAATAERARGQLADKLGYINGVLIDRAHLMGETFTVADCYLFALLRWCDRYDIDLALWPNLERYFEHVEERLAVQAALRAEGLVETRVQRSA